VLREYGLPSGVVARFVDELRDEGYALLQSPPGLALDPWIAELLEQVSTEWVEVPEGFGAERSIGDLALRKRTGASVLAVARGGVNTPNPGPEFALRAGDRLLVFGGGDAIARLRGLLAGAASS
jgi:uncharacterized protein with PhoU and TrkA domain